MSPQGNVSGVLSIQKVNSSRNNLSVIYMATLWDRLSSPEQSQEPLQPNKVNPRFKIYFPPGFTSDSHVTLLHVMFQILTKLKYEAHKFHFIFCTKPLIQTPKILAKSTVEALVDYVKGGKTEQKSCLHGFSLEAISGAKINPNLG